MPWAQFDHNPGTAAVSDQLTRDCAIAGEAATTTGLYGACPTATSPCTSRENASEGPLRHRSHVDSTSCRCRHEHAYLQRPRDPMARSIARWHLPRSPFETRERLSASVISRPEPNRLARRSGPGLYRALHAAADRLALDPPVCRARVRPCASRRACRRPQFASRWNLAHVVRVLKYIGYA